MIWVPAYKVQEKPNENETESKIRFNKKGLFKSKIDINSNPQNNYRK